MNESENRSNRGLPLSMRQIAFLVCVLLVAAILLTYTLTAAAFRRAYTCFWENLRRVLDDQRPTNIVNGL